MKIAPTIETDVLVIGGGGAGLRAAIEASKNNVSVLLVSSSRGGRGSNTALAGGGLAAVTGREEPKDSPSQHLKDTIKAGHFINNPRLVDIMVRGAKQQVHDLLEYGVNFQKSGGGFLIVGIPGHTYPRALVCEHHLGTDFTLPMIQYAQQMGIRFKEGVVITKLLKADETIIGAIGLGKDGQLFIFNAKSTVLATGGLGQVFLRTNNAATVNGAGYSLAYEAGVPLLDMEFTQFYPTTLAGPGMSRLIFYESLVARGGALIRNASGEDILEKYHMKSANTMTRDALAIAIMLEILQGRSKRGALVMDLSAVPKQMLGKELRFMSEKALEEVKELRVAPTCHFHMGGVKINEKGRTRLSGLYAAGEVCGGMHGANRLGANSLTDIFVFGAIAGDSAAKNALEVRQVPIQKGQITDEKRKLESVALSDGEEDARKLRNLLKAIMWYKAGIVRDGEGLKKALKDIDSIRDRLKRVSTTSYRELIKVIELSNMLTVSEMVCRAALKRTESRGAHYRADYPEGNNKQWLKNIEVSGGKGGMRLKAISIEGEEGIIN